MYHDTLKLYQYRDTFTRMYQVSVSRYFWENVSVSVSRYIFNVSLPTLDKQLYHLHTFISLHSACQYCWEIRFTDCSARFLVSGSSGVKDTLGDMNPPASRVLRCLLYLVPSHPYLLEILADDPLQFWRGRPGLLLKPSGSQWSMSLSWDPVTFHAWKMSEPPRSSASDNVFQLARLL